VGGAVRVRVQYSSTTLLRSRYLSLVGGGNGGCRALVSSCLLLSLLLSLSCELNTSLTIRVWPDEPDVRCVYE
jgi:hypothetical protein